MIQDNVPLAPLTTLRVGGAARHYMQAANEEQVRQAVDWAGARQLPLLVLGGGSNLVVADTGWPGLVLHLALLGVEQRGDVFSAAAGEEWDALVARAVAADYGGIECLSGIPGSVGGTPVQNVGAYGQEVSNTIESVRVLDTQNGQTWELAAVECGFRYRASIFNASERGRHIVLRVSYRLRKGADPHIEYADLKGHFAGRKPTLQETREVVRTIRLGKSMLLVEGDENCRSAGSFFKNPIVSQGQAPQGAPQWLLTNGRVKLAAAWLVEQAGFHKGWYRGSVGISTRHALAIVNRGGASAAQIAGLSREIQARVLEKFGVSLDTEPVFVGF